jgi:hypothetical protein
MIGLLCGALLALPLAARLMRASSPGAGQAAGPIATPAAIETPMTPPVTAQRSPGADPEPAALIPRVAIDGPIVQTTADGMIDWTRGRVSVAATPDGDARLMQTLRGLRVDADTRLNDWMRKSPLLSTRIEALTQRTGLPGHGGAGLSVALAGHDGLSALLLAFKLHDGPPSGDIVADGRMSGSGDAAVTLIIDARGLALRPALFPRLLDAAGRSLQALRRVDPNQIAEHGFSVYEASRRAARERLSTGQASRLVEVRGLAPDGVDLILVDEIPRSIQAPIIIVSDKPIIGDGR